MIIDSTSDKINSFGGLIPANKILYSSGFNKFFDLSSNKSDIGDGAVLCSYLNLLIQGRYHFDEIELFRDDESFQMICELCHIPSSATLRQRLDLLSLEDSVLNKLNSMHLNLLKPVSFGTESYSGANLIPCDIDVSVLENANSLKEGTGFTYRNCVGYAPIFAHLGTEGYLLANELRRGEDHSQNGTPEFLNSCVQKLEALNLLDRVLFRMDSAFDCQDNIDHISSVKYIVKRNLRKEAKEYWLEIARILGGPKRLNGRINYIGSIVKDSKRIVFEVELITKDKNGQLLLIPEIKVDTYWTNLEIDPAKVILLYNEHGTSEQFHSELKTDMNIEKLPSGKFQTNQFVLHLAMIAFNVLRRIGQGIVQTKIKVPLKMNASRRRIGSIIKNIIMAPTKIVRHSNKIFAKFYENWKWLEAFEKFYLSI